jgi:hypothetical protein
MIKHMVMNGIALEMGSIGYLRIHGKNRDIDIIDG